MRTSNKVLITVVIAITAYALAAIWLQYKTGTTVDESLTKWWFGFWGVEVLSLAGIKVSKVFKDSSYIDLEDLYESEFKNIPDEKITNDIDIKSED